MNRAPHRTTLELLAEALNLAEDESIAFSAAARRHTSESSSDNAEAAEHDNIADQESTDAYTNAEDDLEVEPVGGFLGATPELPLVARDEEMQAIVAALEAVPHGSGRMIFLAGEPGVGKTRLAQEVSVGARARGFLVVSGRCHEPYQTMPYHPFIEVLTAAYEAASPAIRDELPRSWPDVARLLPGAVHDHTPALFARGPEEQQRLFWSVTRFVQALATWRPVALLLDDLQWADEASLGLLQHLAQHTRASHLFVLCTYRDTDVPRRHPLRRMVHDLGREHVAERIAVSRLPEEGTAALIASAMGTVELPMDLAPLIHRHTDGNAFFTVEVLHALLQRNELALEPGRWANEHTEIVVPETVKSAIDERLARLEPETQALLLEASVLGESFAFEDLATMQAHAEDEVERALEDAMNAAIVQETGPDRYTFNHALTQQTLYRTLPPRRRRRLHLAAGMALEGLPERQRFRRVGDLAWHFTQAEERARALPYVLLTGDQAQALYAHAEAESRYRTAVELARSIGDIAQEAAALTRLGSALLSRAHWDEALAALDPAAEMRRALDDNVGLAETVALMYRLYAHRGTPIEGLDRLRPLLEQLQGGEPTRQLASVYTALGHLYSLAARYDELLAAAEHATELAAAAGDEQVLAEAMGRKGVALMFLGRIEAGRVELDGAIRIAHRLGDLETEVIALNNIAHAYLLTGPLDSALTYFDRVVEGTFRLDSPYLTVMAITNHAQAALQLGRWTEARLDLERADRMARDVGESAFAADPLVTLGRLYLSQGRLQDAARTITEGLTLMGDTLDLQVLREAHGALAERELLSGQPKLALERLLPFLDRVEQEADVTRILWLVAWAYLDTGDLDQAEQVAEDAIMRIHASGMLVSLPDSLRVRAMVANAKGESEQALCLLDEAISVAERLGFPYAKARALLLAGALAGENGDAEKARDLLRSSLEIFERLGARGGADSATEALARHL